MSTKRKRADSDTEDSLKRCRSDSIWFQDGNIILEAEGTQFRVHRGILAKHSIFFKDMFGVPQPPDEPTIEGCPIVRLADTAQDVDHLLNALYDRFYNTTEEQPFSFIAAMVRLGHKYNFTRLRDDAIARLSSDCPTTLREWDSGGLDYFSRIECYPGLSVDVLNLAQEHRLLRILPCVYFTMCDSSQTLKTIVDVGHAAMSKDDLVRCILGVEELRKAALKTFNWLEAVPYPSCLSKECSNRARKLRITLFLDDETPTHALCQWSAQWGERLCKSCAEKAEAAHESNREKFWQSLPAVFGLPDWGKLTNFE